MHITPRVDYAVRTMIEIADRAMHAGFVKAEVVATAQGIPPKVLETVFADLRRGGLINSRRGPDGGYWLTRPAAEISIADVIRAVEGPLASVRGEPPESVSYAGAVEPLQRVWIAVRGSMRAVLENVTLADVAGDRLPAIVSEYTSDPRAWQRQELA